jgi:hypothetical protein
MGSISTLSAGEAELCSQHSLTPRTLGRAWEYWTFRLQKAEAATRTESKPTSAKAPARRSKPARRAAARPARKAKRAKRR